MAVVAWLTTIIAGITASPVTPAENEFVSLPKMTPAAPATWALWERATEPHRRPVPSSHICSTTLPLIAAASAVEYGAQPSMLLPSLSSWLPVTDLGDGRVSHTGLAAQS